MTGYFLSIILGTFILEDVALVSSMALIGEGKISFNMAFLACFIGITVGDLGLYLIGYFASMFQIEKRFKLSKKYYAFIQKIKQSDALTYSILISRAIPGTRIPTYFAAGFLHYSFWKFLVLTIISVFTWVFVALLAGNTIHSLFMGQWILSLLAGFIFIAFLKSFIPLFSDPWKRKAFFHSWRKWTHFEFWPASVFYIPIVPYYIFLAVKYRSFLIPFYANPQLINGGLIGESKWDFLKYLNPKNPSTLPSLKIEKNLDFIRVRELLDQNGFYYPLIIKPDVGQRGFAVRIIRDDFDLNEYLLLSDFEIIIQKLSGYLGEAGIFYIRKPSEDKGQIFSVTDKIFPYVAGDGVTKLGDLILKDQRARIMASVYFERHKEQLDTIPAMGLICQLSECGNHCQGAIFLNGEDLISDELLIEFDRISKEIPDFYFGRFDIRYLDKNSLKKGKKFEIVEINGAGAEATHIWDAKTRLIDAYKTQFIQWKYLFEIGYEIKILTQRSSHINLKAFFKECFKVFFRKENLSIHRKVSLTGFGLKFGRANHKYGVMNCYIK